MNPEAKMFSVEGKVIIITGGAGFFGRQFTTALNQAGAKVVIFDQVNPGADLKASWFKSDITKPKQVEKAVKAVNKKYGRIDVLINNAAMNPMVGSSESEKQFAPYEEYDIDLFRKETEINLIGMEICIQAVVPVMMKQKSGVIVNITSEYCNIAADNRIYGEGRFKSIAYIATKSGVLGLTRGWASYLGKYDIRVVALTPGGMHKSEEMSVEFYKKFSSLNMLGRMANPGEYNGAILFLCSDASSFMTGTQLVMDGGKSAW